jgi:hypothetical protein
MRMIWRKFSLIRLLLDSIDINNSDLKAQLLKKQSHLLDLTDLTVKDQRR